MPASCVIKQHPGPKGRTNNGFWLEDGRIRMRSIHIKGCQFCAAYSPLGQLQGMAAGLICRLEMFILTFRHVTLPVAAADY
jgi:hypothetical protein